MNKLIAALENLIVTADFKSVKKKFVDDQDIEEGLVNEYLDSFKNLRNRITELDHKNIDNWGKKPWAEFKEFIDKLKGTKSKSQEKKLEKTEGAQLIAENDEWFVYKIDTHKACMVYGSGTRWCITEKDGEHWNSYAPKNNFYFLISKTRPSSDEYYKIALQIDMDGEITYWDAKDYSFGLNGVEDANFIKSLPKFKPKKPDKTKYKKIIIDLANRINEYIKNAEPESDDLLESRDDAWDYTWEHIENGQEEDGDLPPELDGLKELYYKLFDKKLLGSGWGDRYSAFVSVVKNLCVTETILDKDYILIDAYAPSSIRLELSDELTEEINDIDEDDGGYSEMLHDHIESDSLDFNPSGYNFQYENDREHELYVMLSREKLKKEITKFKSFLKISTEKNQAKIDKLALTSKIPSVQLMALKHTDNQNVFKEIVKRRVTDKGIHTPYELISVYEEAIKHIKDATLLKRIILDDFYDREKEAAIENAFCTENICKKVLEAKKIHLNYNLRKKVASKITDIPWLEELALSHIAKGKFSVLDSLLERKQANFKFAKKAIDLALKLDYIRNITDMVQEYRKNLDPKVLKYLAQKRVKKADE